MNKFTSTITASLMLFATVAWAGPEVSIVQSVEKDVVSTLNGEQTSKRVKADDITPGETLFFTLSYSNSGDEAATQVAIDSPVPTGTTYILGSAEGNGTEVLIKLNNDTEYQAEASAKITIKGEQLPAQASDVNALRWVVKDIPAATSGSVTFQVTVNG